MNANLKAFLSMIAWSEIGPNLLARSDDGYNVLVGGGLFHSYADHPQKVIEYQPGRFSTAAGRYQILGRYFRSYKIKLMLNNFGHEAQDLIAIQMIRECKALEDIEAGRIPEAIKKCRSRWASFPGAGYNQHEQKFDKLLTAYTTAGGTLA
jgi:muramidase (phage lysozyme)